MTDATDSAATPAPRLKIVIGADTFAPEINGSATFSASLAGGLAKRGHEVRIVAPSGVAHSQGMFLEDHGGAPVKVYRLRSWRWRPHPWYRFALPWRIQANSARILDEFKPDVVHFQSNIVVGRGLSEQALKRGIRVIATNHVIPENILEHSMAPKWFLPFAAKIVWGSAERIYGRAEAMTSPTRKAAELLEANTKLRGVLAISCGLDASLYTPRWERDDENLIVFVGRVTVEKNIDQLIRAFARIDPSVNAKLEVVGGGEMVAELTKLAVSLGVGDRVKFAGYSTTEYLRNALTRATVFAMPSTAELQSIATMEAMASGLPVVAANAIALPHLVHDGENGFLYEPGNIDEFAARLTEVLTMPDDELVKLKKASLDIVQDHDINRTLDTFEALYRGEKVVEPLLEHTPTVRDRIKEKVVSKVRARRDT